MDRKDVVISIVFIALLIVTYYYVNMAMHAISAGRITPEMVDEMDKEELRAFAEVSSSFYDKIGVISFVFILIAVLGLIVGYFISRVGVNDCSSLLNFFPSEERNAIKVVLDEGGHVPQHIWRLKLGINKSKATRLVAKLEKRGIFKVERIGKINRIRLTDSFANSIGFKK